jgi:hypothetical protein
MFECQQGLMAAVEGPGEGPPGTLGEGPIEAVIFDLDGTLLDTETLSTRAIQIVIDPWGKTFTW